jgi:hypothetical protein
MRWGYAGRLQRNLRTRRRSEKLQVQTADLSSWGLHAKHSQDWLCHNCRPGLGFRFELCRPGAQHAAPLLPGPVGELFA